MATFKCQLHGVTSSRCPASVSQDLWGLIGRQDVPQRQPNHSGILVSIVTFLPAMLTIHLQHQKLGGANCSHPSSTWRHYVSSNRWRRPQLTRETMSSTTSAVVFYDNSHITSVRCITASCVRLYLLLFKILLTYETISINDQDLSVKVFVHLAVCILSWMIV